MKIIYSVGINTSLISTLKNKNYKLVIVFYNMVDLSASFNTEKATMASALQKFLKKACKKDSDAFCRPLFISPQL